MTDSVKPWAAMPMNYDGNVDGDDDDWIVYEVGGNGIAWSVEKQDAVHIAELHNAKIETKLQDPLLTESAPPRMIVCAANRKRFTGEIVLGIRHWDAFMRKLETEGDPVDQGFIDQQGLFLNRNEAWKVAEAAGQIRRRVGGDDSDGGTLYSENLY